MRRMNGPLPFVIAGAFALAAAAGFLAWPHSGGNAAARDLATPLLAVETLQGKPLFFTPPARALLVSLKPDLLLPDDREEHSQRGIEFARALQDPRVFRQLDRRDRFDTLLLAGDVNLFRPLLEHILDTRDFSLVYLDHTSFVFRRAPARKWAPEDFEAIRQKFAGRPAREDAEFLAQSAGRLLAVNQPALAKSCLDEALSKDRKSAAAWTQSGYYSERMRMWDAALTDADAALEIQEDYEPALVLRAQALFATKRYSTAYSVTEKLVEMAPGDPQILFLHARICHQARAFQSEVAALKTLVELAEKAGRPAAGYRIYLAQAYASARQTQSSLEEFEKLEGDDTLTVEQKAYVLDSIHRIRSSEGVQ
jgi:Tfp pilus assembly protein PilF